MTAERLNERIYSIDFLRGVVMMIMLLDHTRDFVHAGAFTSDPTDLATTTVPLFFTRWITHYCAPTFVFLSGVSIYLQKLKGKSNRELSIFLITRGIWLIFLELTVVRLGFVFNLDYSSAGMLQVIWVIGVSMIIMGALIYLPVRVIGVIGVAMIFLHNLADSIQVPAATAFQADPPPTMSQIAWMLLHQPGILPLSQSSALFIGYPIIPWVGVMAAGYALGIIYTWEAARRRRWLYIAGIVSTILFVAVRFANVYGDLAPWSSQESAAFTFLSFLNTTKYPPSLLYLLMTLGPAMIVLAATDAIDGKALWQRIAITYGRVPMFYYLVHVFVAHGMGVLLNYLAGNDVSYLFANFSQNAPAGDRGFGLPVTYAAWIMGLIILYPICLWYGNYKRRNKHWLLSYL
jgi:uncharacterized membrane protein